MCIAFVLFVFVFPRFSPYLMEWFRGDSRRERHKAEAAELQKQIEEQQRIGDAAYFQSEPC